MGPSSKYEKHSSTNGVFTSYNQFTAGTSGAVPASFTRAKDLYSVTKGATGVYVFKFNRGATAFLGERISVLQASYSKSGACKGSVTVDDIAGSTKSLTVTFVDGDGDAVDLATGDVVRANFDLKTSPGLA